MTVVHVITRGHVDVHGLCCLLKPCRYLWAVLPPGAMLVSVAHVAVRGHADAHGLCFYRVMKLYMVHAVVKAYIDVCGPCCCWEPC